MYSSLHYAASPSQSISNRQQQHPTTFSSPARYPSARTTTTSPRRGGGRASSPTTATVVNTTRLFTHEHILRQLQSDVADKVDISLAAHHMTYGVLLREIEKLVTERQALRQEILETKRIADTAEANLASAIRNSELLQENVASLKDDIEDKEKIILHWAQRFDRTQQDVKELRSELERTVKESDQNRVLLAAEVRNRATMLASMHEEVRNDLQRSLFVRESSQHHQSSSGGGHSSLAGNSTNDGMRGSRQGSPEPRKEGGLRYNIANHNNSSSNAAAADVPYTPKSTTVPLPTPSAVLSSQQTSFGKIASGANTTSTTSSSSQHFQRLEEEQREMVENVRRQLACDVPRVVDVHNTATRLHFAETSNGSHHSAGTSGSRSSPLRSSTHHHNPSSPAVSFIGSGGSAYQQQQHQQQQHDHRRSPPRLGAASSSTASAPASSGHRAQNYARVLTSPPMPNYNTSHHQQQQQQQQQPLLSGQHHYNNNNAQAPSSVPWATARGTTSATSSNLPNGGGGAALSSPVPWQR